MQHPSIRCAWLTDPVSVLPSADKDCCPQFSKELNKCLWPLPAHLDLDLNLYHFFHLIKMAVRLLMLGDRGLFVRFKKSVLPSTPSSSVLFSAGYFSFNCSFLFQAFPNPFHENSLLIYNCSLLLRTLISFHVLF